MFLNFYTSRLINNKKGATLLSDQLKNLQTFHIYLIIYWDRNYYLFNRIKENTVFFSSQGKQSSVCVLWDIHTLGSWLE